MAKEQANSNVALAAIIAVCSCLLFVALLISLYLMPSKTLQFFDQIDVKVVLVALIFALISAGAILVYSLFYLPTARRLASAAFSTIVAFSTFAMGYSLVGWPKIKAVEWDGERASATFLDIGETSFETYPVLLTCFAAIIIIVLINILVRHLDVKHDFEF